MESIKTVLEEYKAKKAEYKEVLKESLKKTITSLFDEVPELTAVAWTQYSPYFNDGDPCVFSVNTPFFTNVPIDRIEGSDLVDDNVELDATANEWVKSFWSERSVTTGIDEKLFAFSALIQDAEIEEVLEAMFGDGSLVFVTREGINSSEYDHE